MSGIIRLLILHKATDLERGISLVITITEVIAINIDQSGIHDRSTPVALHDLAIRTYEDTEGDTIEVIYLREVIIESLQRRTLRPVHTLALDGCQPCRLAIVHRDTQDLKALRMITLISLLEMRDVCTTGSAPTGPELQQDILALTAIVADTDGLTLGSLQLMVVEHRTRHTHLHTVHTVNGLLTESCLFDLGRNSGLQTVDLLQIQHRCIIIERIDTGRSGDVILQIICHVIHHRLLLRLGGTDSLNTLFQRTLVPA